MALMNLTKPSPCPILAANVEIDQPQIPITIEDSDSSPDLLLVADTPDEGDGELGINLTLSTPSEKQISGNIVLEPGNAFSPALRPKLCP